MNTPQSTKLLKTLAIFDGVALAALYAYAILVGFANNATTLDIFMPSRRDSGFVEFDVAGYTIMHAVVIAAVASTLMVSRMMFKQSQAPVAVVMAGVSAVATTIFTAMVAGSILYHEMGSLAAGIGAGISILAGISVFIYIFLTHIAKPSTKK